MGLKLGQNNKKFTIGTGTASFGLVRVDREEIVQIGRFSLYNSHVTQTVTYYFGIQREGIFHRYHYKSALAAGLIDEIANNLYLVGGDELWISVVGSGAGTTFEVSFQLLDIK